MPKLNIKMNGLTSMGYLCFLLSFIFAIVGMSIDPKSPDMAELTDGSSHSNKAFQNMTFSQFGTTLAVMGLGFFYIGHQ